MAEGFVHSLVSQAVSPIFRGLRRGREGADDYGIVIVKRADMISKSIIRNLNRSLFQN